LAKKKLPRKHVILLLLLLAFTVLSTYWAQNYPIYKSSWGSPTRYPYVPSLVYTGSDWEEIHVPANFSAGESVTGNLTFEGASPPGTGTFARSLCILTDEQYRTWKVYTQIPSDVGALCFSRPYSYYDANRTYVIPFKALLPDPGTYHFFFLAEYTSYTKASLTIYRMQQTRDQLQVLLPIIFAVLSGVVSIFSGAEYHKKSK
jgi:hypothetical protein